MCWKPCAPPAFLGGEQSGHIIFRQFSTTGDGILTALQLLANLKESGKAMSELAGVMTRFPQVLVIVRVGTKEGWQDNEAICEAIERVKLFWAKKDAFWCAPRGRKS